MTFEMAVDFWVFSTVLSLIALAIWTAASLPVHVPKGSVPWDYATTGQKVLGIYVLVSLCLQAMLLIVTVLSALIHIGTSPT